MCRQAIEEVDIAHCCPEAVEEVQARRADGAEVAEQPPTSRMEREIQAFRWRRIAQRAHLKICPGCRSPIEKNLGCNHMTCHCGRSFDWLTAETVAPCHRLHRGRGWKIWGSTCPGCSPLAKVKLAALRAVVVVGAVPAAVVSVPVAAVVLLPMAGFAAVKKYRRQRRMCRRALGAEDWESAYISQTHDTSDDDDDLTTSLPMSGDETSDLDEVHLADPEDSFRAYLRATAIHI